MPKIHTVQSGDTLSEIAENYSGVDYQDIYNANRDILDNPNEIYPGQQLDIPSSQAETSSVDEVGSWQLTSSPTKLVPPFEGDSKSG